MKRKMRRVLAILLALVVSTSAVDVQVLAEESSLSEETGFSEDLENGDDVSDGDTISDESVSASSSDKAENVLYEDDSCTIEYEIASQWGTGYNMNIIITNIGSASISDWSFEIQTSDSINNLWNASYEKCENGYKICAFDWNKSIEQDGNIIIGYTASNGENEISVPYIDAVTIKTNSLSSGDTENNFTGDYFAVDYQVVDSWKNASNVKVTIRNLTNTTIHNWGLRFISSDAFENIYNGVELGEGDVHLIKNLGWNQDIPANGEVQFGFTQTYSGEIEIPEDFELVSTKEILENTNYKIDIVEETKVNEGRNIQLVIENLSSETIEDWCLKFDANFTVVEIWNGELISQDENGITIGNASYAQNILPNESCFVGMIVNCPEENISVNNCILTETKPNYAGSENKKDENDNHKKDDYESDDNNKINKIYFDTYSIATNKTVSCKIWAMTSGKEGSVLKVYKKTNDNWLYVADLYDSGNMSHHNDEIANDGIYTNVVSLYETNAGIVQYKFSLVVNGVEKDFVIKDIEVVDAVNEEEFNAFISDIEDIMNIIQQYMESSNYTYDVTVDELVALINEKSSNESINVERINGSSIKITCNNGLSSFIQFSDKSDMDTMIRGSGSTSSEGGTGAIEIATTESGKILYWAPFDTEWGDSDETESIKNIVEESEYSHNYDVLSDAAADVESLKKLSEYGLIIFATHGIGGEWIVTGEKVSTNPKYLKELSNNQISVYYDYDPSDNGYESYYMVNDKWFLGNISNDLPNSIIINNSCESSKTDILWNAFKELGARTYYGNDGAITNQYATVKCSYIVSKLVLDREITGDVLNASLDAYYNNGAALVVRGQGNLSLSNSISNAGFENGMLFWGTQGDCRVLNKLGNIKPTEGKYMGMISTGIGYTMQGGAITQRIHVPQEAKSMYFDWNFLSAEFLEYINSSYDDPFEIIVECGDDEQNKEVILRKSVNSLAEDFKATKTSAGKLICVSPSIQLNSYNDIWMTDWQTEIVDISKYSGKTITLTFGVTNAADTQYPSAVLLDNIHLDMEYVSSNQYYEAHNPNSVTNNNYGRSYIMYTEDFAEKVDAMRKNIKYKNGYTSDEQIDVKKIETEAEFIEYWNNMTPGSVDFAIDNVVIMMHGNYYAIIIDSAMNDANTAYKPDKNPENLTICENGKVGTDYDATYIGDLKRHNIKELNLYTCNAGLLDAINAEHEKKLSKVTGHENEKYVTKGNVAQLFLKSQNVSTITAYDGSVGYDKSTNLPRLSYAQGHYVGMLDALANVRKIKPYRNSAKLPLEYVVSTGLKDGVDLTERTGIMPNGEVIYSNNKAVYEYSGYKQELRTLNGIPYTVIVPFKQKVIVDLDNNTQTGADVSVA